LARALPYTASPFTRSHMVLKIIHRIAEMIVDIFERDWETAAAKLEIYQYTT